MKNTSTAQVTPSAPNEESKSEFMPLEVLPYHLLTLNIPCNKNHVSFQQRNTPLKFKQKVKNGLILQWTHIALQLLAVPMNQIVLVQNFDIPKKATRANTFHNPISLLALFIGILDKRQHRPKTKKIYQKLNILLGYQENIAQKRV